MNWDSELINILYKALESEFGIIVHASSFSKCKERMNKIMNELGDENLKSLRIYEMNYKGGNMIISKEKLNI